MNSVEISGIVFAFLFGGAQLGMFLRGILPEEHLSSASRDLVKMGIGMIATMTALVLGLLVYNTQTRELTEMSAKIVVLDSVLTIMDLTRTPHARCCGTSALLTHANATNRKIRAEDDG